jgi:hypothetical protein
MAGFFEDDLPDMTEADVNDFASKSFVPPPGKYPAMLSGWTETSSQSGNTGEELTFTITAGQQKGSEVKDTLWHRGKDDNSTKMMQSRAAMFGSRLGLLVAGLGGKLTKATGKTGLKSCLGVACVIDVINEKYTKKDGTEGVKAKLAYKGIYAASDPTVKAILEGVTTPPLATPLATGGTSTGSAGIDLSEL